MPPKPQQQKPGKKVEFDKKVHAVPPKANPFTHPPAFNPNQHNPSWTDADDATLLRMVDANFQWPMIAAALGRQVDDVASRWSQIGPARGSDAKGGAKKDGGKQDKSGAKKGGPKVCDASVLRIFFFLFF